MGTGCLFVSGLSWTKEKNTTNFLLCRNRTSLHNLIKYTSSFPTSLPNHWHAQRPWFHAIVFTGAFLTRIRGQSRRPEFAAGIDETRFEKHDILLGIRTPMCREWLKSNCTVLKYTGRALVSKTRCVLYTFLLTLQGQRCCRFIILMTTTRLHNIITNKMSTVEVLYTYFKYHTLKLV